jgi:hypothetical protein
MSVMPNGPIGIPPADHPGSVDVVDGSDPLVDQVERLPFDRRPDPVVLDIEEV